MKKTFRKIIKKNAFDPSWIGVFLNEAYLTRRTIASAIREHAPKLSGVLVDYGCGSKPYQSLFSASRYIGADVRISGHPNDEKRADIYLDDFRIPLETGTVDSVLMSEVFEHVFDPAATLHEIHRILKPGGLVLMTCPFVWPLHEEPFDYARYTPYALRAEFESYGFEVVAQEKRGSDWEAIAQLANCYFGEVLTPRVPIVGRLLSVAYNTVFNLLGLAGRLLPRTGKLYLTNVVLARRV